MQANISLVIHLSNQLFADPRRIRLLLAIEETGSITRGARLAEVSYKTAWDAIDAMNTLAEQTIVERVAGEKAVAVPTSRSMADECSGYISYWNRSSRKHLMCCRKTTSL